MTKIHMETEYVRAIARLLDQKAMDIDYSIEALKRSRNRLTGAWSGGSTEKRFMSDYNSLLSLLDSKAQELQSLSLKLYREVDDWEKADSFKSQTTISVGKTITGFWMGSLGFGGIPLYGNHFHLLNFDINSESVIGLDGDISEWTPDTDWKPGEGKLGVDAKFSLIDDALYDAEDLTYTESVFGLNSLYRGDIQLGDYEAGAKIGIDEDGFTAGAYGEWDSVKLTGTKCMGSAVFGFTGGITATALSAEAFAGIKDNTLGASVGASLASVEFSQGMNLAGVNVGVKAGLSAGLEFGIKLGADSELKFGPFKVGLNFGQAIV